MSQLDRLTVSDRDYFSTTFSKIEINFPGTFGHNALHILFKPHDAHQVFLHAGEDRSLCSIKKLGQRWEGRRKAVKNGWVITLLIWAKN
jgi:hypothetical protein